MRFGNLSVFRSFSEANFASFTKLPMAERNEEISSSIRERFCSVVNINEFLNILASSEFIPAGYLGMYIPYVYASHSKDRNAGSNWRKSTGLEQPQAP